jgi:hypothetical protein
MKHFIFTILVLGIAASVFAAGRPMHVLTLRWQKPAVEREHACGVTEPELQQALHKLTQSLKKSNTEVQLGYLRGGTLPDAPATGLWINGKPLETWLNAEVVAEESGCTTLKLAEKSYDRIPAEVIVKAGMIAAGQPVSTIPSAIPAVTVQR